jgi:hypothetical protein
VSASSGSRSELEATRAWRGESALNIAACEGSVHEALAQAVVNHALVAAKRAIIDGLRLPLSEGLRLEAHLFAECQSDPATLALQDRIRERYRGTPPDVPVRF